MKPLATATVIVVTVAVTAAIVWGVAAVASPSLLDAISKLGPVTTGLVAIFALIVGISTIRQKQSADAATAESERRDQWWKRAQWAIDRLYEPPEERQVVAWLILQSLAESNLAGDEELAIFDAVAQRRLNELTIADTGGPGHPVVGNTGDEQEGVPP